MTEMPKDVADQYWANVTTDTASGIEHMSDAEREVFVRDYKMKMAALERHYHRLHLLEAIAGDDEQKHSYTRAWVERNMGKRYFVEIHIEDLDIKTLPEYQQIYDRVLARVQRMTLGIEYVAPCPYSRFTPQINWERK